MRPWLADVRRQIRMGTAVGLTIGALVGLALGISFVSLRYASILFDGLDTRMVAVVLLASGSALVCAALLIPVAIAVSMARWIWPHGSIGPSRVLYASALFIGLGALHAGLFVTLRYVRNIREPRGVAILIGIVLVAAGLLALSVRLARRGTASSHPPPGRTTALRLALLAVLCVACIRYLHPRLGAGMPSAPLPEVAQARISHAADPRPPNVILVSIDTLRADHLRSYGYTRDATPNLDAFGLESAVFLDARSPSPWTLPSHASMFTSRYPVSHGVRFFSNFRFQRASADRLGNWNETLAELLRSAGYRTGAVTSVEWLGQQFGLDQGFDYVENSREGHDAGTVVDKGQRWIAQDPARPFFLFLHLFDVHDYRSPPAFSGLYTSAQYHGPVEGHRDHLISNLFTTLDSEDIDYAKGRYDESLRFVDRELGRLLDGLRRSALYDDTMIVITSDHGEEFWDHGGTGHGFTLYDEILRVPLVIKPPRRLPVRHHRQTGLSGIIDIAPTVLDYAGLSPSPVMEGISLRPLIESDAPPPPRTMYAGETFHFNAYAVIEPGYKFIEYRVPPARILNAALLLANVRALYWFRQSELFRLDEDPGEQHNIADRGTQARTRLSTVLLSHLQRAGRGESMLLDAETRERLRSLGYIH